MVTTDIWAKMSPRERLMYKLIRHPMTILFGYFTIFLYGMCISSFLRTPRKNWDSLLAVIVNVVLSATLWYFFGFEVYFFAFFLPLFVATASGAYLFYAQHNFPEMHVQPRESWEYTRAALESSSYMRTGPILGWLTGNIGYHHVHHLNPGIPFYRLPEAMAGMPELQSPRVTSLSPKDIVACFRQKLWDSERQQMVGYPDDGAPSASQPAAA
jgi:omega-6 fatty acid desaturase (delta-12 desaturase)